jgi:hypothetical protein
VLAVGSANDGESRRGRARRVSRRLLCALCALAAGLALSCSSAVALSQRGHVFGESFGKTGAGQLSSVAVNETTHEVYVVDRPAGVVEQFRMGAEGKYESSGTELTVPSPEYVAVDNSREPGDPSAGDVYVSSSSGSKSAPKGAIYRFTKTGAELPKITKAKELAEAPLRFGRIIGLAVSAKGVLWVDQELEAEFVVDRLSDAEPKKGVASLLSVPSLASFLQSAPGFAVNSTEQDVYFGQTNETREEAEGEEVEEPVALCTRTPCVIAKLAAVEEEAESGFLPEVSLNELVPAVVGQNTSAIAVDLFGEVASQDDAYLDNLTSVTVLNSSGSLVQRFGSPEPGFEEGLQEGRGIAIESKTGNVFVVDAKAGQVDLFKPVPPGPPAVDHISAAKVRSQSAELNAEIDPGGVETEYTFQYGTTAPVSCAPVSAAPCEAPVPAGKIVAAFGDQPVGIEVTGLQPGSEYHYRVIATNRDGRFVSEERTFTTRAQSSSELALPDSREWEMVSPPEKLGAGIEPMRAVGGTIQAAAGGDAISYVADAPIEEHIEGNRNFEPAQVLSTRGSKGWTSQDVSTRDETSQGPIAGGRSPEYMLFSSDLSLALVYPFDGRGQLAEPPLSPPLEDETEQEATAYIRADGPNPPLAPEASNEEIYDAARHDGEEMGNAGYVALVNHLDDTSDRPFGKQFEVINATPDLSHVVLRGSVPLTSKAAPVGIYEWSTGALPAGNLQLVSLLPDGEPAPKPELGTNEAQNTRNAISSKGSRLFWSNEGTLYMRDMGKEETIDLSAVQQKEDQGAPGAEFEVASADGSRVLFEDTQRLVEGSGAAELNDSGVAGPDLYECEIIEVPGKEGKEEDECRLSDLTPEHEGTSAVVLGMVLGASEEDLSRVYFVANGVLSSNANAEGEKAEAGNCVMNVAPPAGATCNLYVSEPDPEHPGQRETVFIARLSNEDVPDWGEQEQRLTLLTSRVSPNGEYLTFMSDRSLTGYDNTDAKSGQPDEEVYLYDAATNHLDCASCNPSGARPVGVLDTREAGGEGLGLLVDRREIWSTENELNEAHWLAGSIPGWTPSNLQDALYQSRYLSNSGRLFFDSADALVPQDTNGKEDVYEYEPPGVGSCTSSAATFSAAQGGCIGLISSGTSSRESAFLDASETGGDVFFLTAASLVKQDVDTAFDVYDAHECTGASPCLEAEPSKPGGCDSEESCRGASTPPPAFSAPTSTTFSGAGNVVPAQQALPFKTTVKPKTRAQLLAGALKSCRKKKSKAKRLACERQARKKYGPKSKKSAKSSKQERSAKRSSR